MELVGFIIAIFAAVAAGVWLCGRPAALGFGTDGKKEPTARPTPATKAPAPTRRKKKRRPAAHARGQKRAGGAGPRAARARGGRTREDKKQNPCVEYTLGGHSKNVLQACWSPDGSLVASVGSEGALRVFATDGATHPYFHHADKFAQPVTVTFAPDSSELVVALRSGRLRFYRIARGPRKDDSGVAFPSGTVLESREISTPHSGAIHSVVVAPSGQRFVTCAGGDDTAVHFLETTGRAFKTVSLKQMGNLMMGGSTNGLISFGAKYGDPKVFSLVAKGGPKQVMTLRGHRKGVACVSFGRRGDTCATASLDGTLRLFRTGVKLDIGEDAKLLYEAKTGFASCSLVAVCPGKDADLIAVSSAGELRFFVGSTGSMFYKCSNPHGGALVSLSFSPDGKLMLSAGGINTKIWSVSKILEQRTGA